jgi:hypothetical protein
MTPRRKKNFPLGTFIPFPQRLMAILQLCLAFSLILWSLSQPFMGEYFTIRSRLLLYDYVMGSSDILKNREGQEVKLEHNREWFEQLDPQIKDPLMKHYQEIQTYGQRPTWFKIGQGFEYLLREVPLFEQGWLFLSIVVSVLILLKIEGAKEAAWLLPLLVLAYGINNQLYDSLPSLPVDTYLFPTEKEVISHYLDKPLANTVTEQKEQLEKGWQAYLLKNWLPFFAKNMSDSLQIEASEFTFTLARLEVLQEQPLREWLLPKPVRLHLMIVAIYILWNCLFAWIMNRNTQFIISNTPIPAK